VNAELLMNDIGHDDVICSVTLGAVFGPIVLDREAGGSE
jgi:hypothetical protein